jgi:hypothetical protein
MLAGSSIASDNLVISTFSDNSVQIRSARVVRALGGGFHVTGVIEPSFGYTAPRLAHVRVAVYDSKGKVLAQEIDRIGGSKLIRWHLRPKPRAPYVVFFPLEPSQISTVTIVEGKQDGRRTDTPSSPSLADSCRLTERVPCKFTTGRRGRAC